MVGQDPNGCDKRPLSLCATLGAVGHKHAVPRRGGGLFLVFRRLQDVKASIRAVKIAMKNELPAAERVMVSSRGVSRKPCFSGFGAPTKKRAAVGFCVKP